MPAERLRGSVRGAVSCAAAALLAACASSSSTSSPKAEPNAKPAAVDTTATTVVAVPIEDLADVTRTIPDGAAEIDLGTLAPAPSSDFCTAWSSVPGDWVFDAVVPRQFWIDTWEAVLDVPAAASAPLAALRQYSADRLAWDLGASEVRPEITEDLYQALLELADAAVAECEALPLVVEPAIGEPQPVTPLEPAACLAALDELDTAIAAYRERRGSEPGHVVQVELESTIAVFYSGRGDYYFAIEPVGVGIGPDGRASAVGAPGSDCGRR